MIKKLTSAEFMNILEDSKEKIEETRIDLYSVKDELENKLKVITNCQEYQAKRLGEIIEQRYDKASMNLNSKTVVFAKKESDGEHDIYGQTVHPKFIKTPFNVFNFSSQVGPIFKNNAIVKINGEEDEEFKALLMHDAIKGQGIAFKEFTSPKIRLEVILNADDLLGATGFNVIEMLPIIPGSFDIEYLQIYTIKDHKTGNNIAPTVSIYNKIDNVGTNRFILDDVYELYRFVIDININFKNEAGNYPFGLKHLYFLNADMKASSKIIYEVNTDHYIDWISEDIIIKDQYGIRESTCNEEGINLYMDNSNGILEYKIETSKGLTQNSIPRNIKKFYIELPIKFSYMSMRFKDIGERI